MKQVEKIWAELSAKAQEVETPQEVELSEEQKVELASGAKLASAAKALQKAVEKIGGADAMYKALISFGKVIADASQAQNEANAQLEAYAKALAELDIKPNEAPAYKNVSKMVKESEGSLKKAIKVRNDIKSSLAGL